MQAPVCPDLGAIYSRDPREPSVLVVDGYGIHLRVERGHLNISDGVGSHRRQRRLDRSGRTVRRLVLLGHTGSVTLDALRWCADVGISLTHIDSDGRLLATLAAEQHSDSRLVRAQALAHTTGHAMPLAIGLVEAKLAGHADLARTRLNSPRAAFAIDQARTRLADASSADEVLRIEAAAARDYFATWRHLTVQFPRRDTAHIPAAWLGFDQRTSRLVTGSSPRSAADPINALLNYTYTLATAETALACRALGLDPGLGVLHSDRKDRDSLALDVLEAVRPSVDRYILDLIAEHVFSRADFTQTRDGRCRILAPLTHTLAQTTPTWATTVAPYAEHVAHTLANAADGAVRHRRPLTGKTTSSPRRATVNPVRAPRPDPNCPDCGQPLGDRRRLRCPVCHSAARIGLARERAEQTAAHLAALLATVPRPGGSVMRSARVAAQRAAAAAWDADHPGLVPDLEFYRQQVLPGLQPVPIAAIGEAIGVGHDAAWRIREGTLTPHQRHWAALATLSGSGVELATLQQALAVLDQSSDDPAREGAR